jgi:hypothetical protein
MALLARKVPHGLMSDQPNIFHSTRSPQSHRFVHESQRKARTVLLQLAPAWRRPSDIPHKARRMARSICRQYFASERAQDAPPAAPLAESQRPDDRAGIRDNDLGLDRRGTLNNQVGDVSIDQAEQLPGDQGVGAKCAAAVRPLRDYLIFQ